MKKLSLILVLLALALASAFAVGLAFVSCDDGGGTTSGGGNIPAALVAKWYVTQALADEGGNAYIEVTSDGRMQNSPSSSTVPLTIRVSGDTLTLYRDGYEQGWVRFSINGTVLTTSDGTGSAGFARNRNYYKKVN